MPEWSRKYEKCNSCATTEISHKAKGYCTKCHPIITSLEIVQAWDSSDPSTLKPISGFGSSIISQVQNSRKLEHAKNELLRQFQNRLKLYKNSVDPEKVSGSNIEYLFDEFAMLILKDKGIQMFHGTAGYYETNFNEAQRRKIFKDLSKILASKRFTIDLYKVLLPNR